MMDKNAIGFSNFTLFSKEFERHINVSKTILDRALLHLIKECFGYGTISLSSYDQSRFNGIEVISDNDTASIKNSYQSYFQKRDPFAAYIGKTCRDDPDVSTLQSSSAFRYNYFKNEYYNYLNHFGLTWSLAMPIGKYRLTVYRETGDRDFSQNERDAMELLSQMLKKAYYDAEEISPIALSCSMEGKVLDTLDVGFLSFDKNLNVLTYNRKAYDFLCGDSPFEDVQKAGARLFHQIKEKGTEKHNAAGQTSKWLDFMDNTLVLEAAVSEETGESFYSVTIYSGRSGSSLGERSVEPALLMERYDLSEREAEIACMLVRGFTYQQTAEALFISINTVRTHVCSLYRKIGVNSKQSLMKIFQVLL